MGLKPSGMFLEAIAPPDDVRVKKMRLENCYSACLMGSYGFRIFWPFFAVGGGMSVCLGLKEG